MKRQKEGPVGRGRGHKKTSQNKFACHASIPAPQRISKPEHASQAALRDAWIAATTDQLAREIHLVALAADRLARGYGLGGDDLDRLHQAHQFLFRCLGILRNSRGPI